MSEDWTESDCAASRHST